MKARASVLMAPDSLASPFQTRYLDSADIRSLLRRKGVENVLLE